MPTLFVRLALAAIFLVSIVHGQNVGLVRNAPVLRSGQTLGDIAFELGTAAVKINLNTKLEYPSASADYARIQTPLGDIYLEFLTADAPKTVANFKSYLANDNTTAAEKPNTFDGTFVHRAVPGFIIQTGGYQPLTGLPEIPTRLDQDGNPITVENEFGAANTRGTVAMAKLPDAPDSATHEWFFNLADNRANLDNQNEGFTAFARVLGNGMAVVDRIASLNQLDLDGPQSSSAFDNLPYYNVQAGQSQLELFNLFPLTTVRSVPASAVPATLRAAPVITTKVVSTPLPAVAKVTVAQNILTVTPGRFGGRFPVTVRATAGNDISDFTFDVIKNGAPGILSKLPALTTQYLGNPVTMLVDITARPAAGVVWERKPRGSSVFSIVTASELFTFTEAGDLVVRLDAADSAAALDLSDSQFRYRTTNIFGTATSSITTLRVVHRKLFLATSETVALPGLEAQTGRVFSATGLPKGLALNPTTGALSGKPLVKPGVYKFVVTRRDAGAIAGTRVYYVKIAQP